jgi:hypothetical protein
MRSREKSTPDARLQELAAILAVGVRRLLRKPTLPPNLNLNSDPSLSEKSSANPLDVTPETALSVSTGVNGAPKTREKDRTFVVSEWIRRPYPRDPSGATCMPPKRVRVVKRNSCSVCRLGNLKFGAEFFNLGQPLGRQTIRPDVDRIAAERALVVPSRSGRPTRQQLDCVQHPEGADEKWQCNLVRSPSTP